MGGRRAKYTTRIAKRICEHIALGATVDQALQKEPLGPSVSLFWRWMDEFPEFREMYERARQMQTDILADKILQMAADVLEKPSLAPAYRIASDILRWHAEVKNPTRYGNKVTIEHKKTLDPKSIVKEIKQLEKELGMISKGEIIDVPMIEK
jgi:hypothetical protein